MASSSKSGLDLRWVNPSIRPQDDLFGHVNGKWLESYEIPDDRASDGAFRALRDQSEDHVRVIIEEAASTEGNEARMIAALYKAFMDTHRIESLGTQPAQPLLQAIDQAQSKEELASVLGSLERQGRTALFGGYVNMDAKDSSRYVLYMSQSGLGLPDESYYREDSYAGVREQYVAHLTRMAELFGIDDAAALAATVMNLETAIAKVSWDRVANRDAEKTYNLMKLSELKEQAPGFAWDSLLTATNVPAIDVLVVRQPSFVIEAAKVWADRPLEEWKAWLKVRTMSACAAYLNEAVVEENFSFYGRTLTGAPQIRERWRRGVSFVEGVVGEAVGKLYVARHFPESSKEHMLTLVNNLTEAYRQSINSLDWMSAETRERALAKLGQFTPKIGYPDKWKDYSTLDVRDDDLLGNVLRASVWEHDYELAKLGKPVDRDEWFMTPQTVNAYYNPLMNEVVFPAAILQPPFFDPEADDAANYGGIGAVIGHEIGHGFDDQGSRFDGAGNLQDWWEESDREEFMRRAQGLIDQYNGLSPAGLPEHHVNGALTVGENIGDLGGLTIAIKAYELSLEGREAPVIDGLTGLQRVFYGWAQVWRGKYREEEALRLLAIDPHSPPNLRCNAVVSNLDAFDEAFGVSEADALYRKPEDRVSIW